ncbi:MAG: hypothetical protein ACK56I_19850, partial [bacterium]
RRRRRSRHHVAVDEPTFLARQNGRLVAVAALARRPETLAHRVDHVGHQVPVGDLGGRGGGEAERQLLQHEDGLVQGPVLLDEPVRPGCVRNSCSSDPGDPRHAHLKAAAATRKKCSRRRVLATNDGYA